MSKVIKSVGNAISGAVKGVVNVVKDVVKAVGKVVGAVVDFVGQAFMGIFGGMSAPDAAGEADRQQGVLVQKEGSNVNIPIVYGIRKVGGIMTFCTTGSDNNKYLWVAYVLSEGPIEGLDELYIDDNIFPTDVCARLNAGQLVTIENQPAKSPTEKYNGRVQFRFVNGLWYNNPADSPVGNDITAGIFAGIPSDVWNNKMIYNGLAVLFARYEWKAITTQAEADNNPFSGNVPQIQAVLHGRKVQPLSTVYYNTDGTVNNTVTGLLRTISGSFWGVVAALSNFVTTIGPASDTAYDRNAGRWSNNPVEILFDYLRSPHYGKGLKSNEIDSASWITAANKCNQPVTYYTGIRGPILTCNAVVDTGQTLFNNTKTLLAGFRGFMPYIQGRYKLKIEDAGHETDIMSGVATIVQEITLNEIVGDITYTGIERTSKYNQVVVNYVEPAQKWSVQQVYYPDTEAKRQVYIAEDGGRELKGEATFGTITNSSIAQDMARLIFNKQRYQETCSFKMSAQGFELEPGDNITIKGNLIDLTDTPWRVVSTKINNDYTVDIGCVRNPDNVKLENGTYGSFYPYGRYNEPDIIRPPYIPKGNEIYWPGTGTPNIGLAPPSNVPYNPGPAVPPTNPPISNPTDPGAPGGGTGGGGSVGGGGNIVITPPTGIITKTYDDFVDFTSATLTNNTWTVNFVLPSTLSSGEYGGLMIWYQPTTAITGQFYQLADLSSGQRSFSFPASTNTAISYNIRTRIKYAGGNVSTKSGSVTVGQTGLTNERGETYNFSGIIIGDQNFINKDASPNMKNYTVNAGVSPKSVTFTFGEIDARYINGQPGSTAMTSMLIYYKVEGATGWKLSEYTLPSSYAANQEFTHTIQDFGVSSRYYTVLFRWKFRDGSLGNYVDKQNIDVAYSGTYQGAANGIQLATNFDFTLAANSAANNISIPTVAYIQGGLGKMNIGIADPRPSPQSMTDFLGVRIEIAKIVAGQPINYTAQEFTIGNGLRDYTGYSGNFEASFASVAYNTNAKYNIIVRMMYAIAGGSAGFSSNAVKYTGTFVSDSLDKISDGSLVKNTNTDYATLKGDGGTIAAGGGPTEVVCVPSYAYDNYVGTATNSTDTYHGGYFTLGFTFPSGVTAIRVYRDGGGGMEYTVLNSSGNVRYGVSGNTVIFTGEGTYNTLSTVTYGGKNTLYLRCYTGSTASNKVFRIVPQYFPNSTIPRVDILGSNYDTVSHTLDLTSNGTLATQLNGATNTATREIAYRILDYTVGNGWVHGVYNP